MKIEQQAIFEIIYNNGGDSGGRNYALKKHTFFFNLKMALNVQVEG